MQQQEWEAEVRLVQITEAQHTVVPPYLLARERDRTSTLARGKFDPLPLMLSSDRVLTAEEPLPLQ